MLVERRTWQPLLAPLFFRSWAFVTANLAQMLEGMALIIALVTVPLMADTVMGKQPLTGAWWLLRMTVAIPIGAVVGGYLLRIIGIRPVTIMGLGLAALGLFLVSTWELDIAEPWLTLHLMVAGFGFGLNNTPIMTRALSSVGLDHQATGASLVTVSRMLGMALGIAALSSWGVEHVQALTIGLELPVQGVGEISESIRVRVEEYTAGLNDAGLSLFHDFFRVAGALALVAISPAALMRPDHREKEETIQPRGD